MTLVHVYNTILYKLRIPGGFRICKKKKKKEHLIDKIYHGILKLCNIGIGKIRGKHPKRPY